jgi:membrane-associated phospholipid phosphatase
MYKMMIPFWFLSLMMGACVALIISLCINFYWKISAHTLGIGGLLGGIMGVARIHLINPYWGFIIILLAAGLVGTSRIFLKRHTPMQVYAGFCLGFICTFVASLLSYIYLFI